jgi:DNA-binding NtrC family response regulator
VGGPGRFRKDLFRRLAVGIFQIPSLRERGGGLLLLVDYLMEKIVEEFGGECKKISVNGRKFLSRHVWPGNVRELHNVLMRCVLWSQGRSIAAGYVLAALQRPSVVPSTLAVRRPPISEGFDIHREMGEFAANYVPRPWVGRMEKRHKPLSCSDLLVTRLARIG